MVSTPSSINQSNRSEDPEQVEVGYSSRVLVQALFPYKRRDTDKVTLTRGPLTYTVSSTAGLPYGRYPRLLLAYLATQAVKRRGLPEEDGRRIPLGSSLREFFALIGMDHRVRGGTRGSITLLREQVRRLTHTSITIEKRWSARDQVTNMFLADSMDVSFSSSAAEGQDTLEPSYIELSLPFWRELVAHPIPINLAILTALSKPRAIDLYVWTTVQRFAHPCGIQTTWDNLAHLFAPHATTSRQRLDFKADLAKAVASVNQAWPEAHLTLNPRTGLTIPGGPPSIPTRAGSPRASSTESR